MPTVLARAAGLGLTMVLTAACAGSSVVAQESEPPATVPFTMQQPLSGTRDRGFVGLLDVDHITLDPSGVYLCVLRRNDDLASLRAQFNTPGS